MPTTTVRGVSPSRLAAFLFVVVAASPLSAQYALTTTFVSNNGAAGNMFDVIAAPAADLAVRGFDVHLQAGTFDVEVWRRTAFGSHVGHETNPASWTRIATYAGITSVGAGIATALPRDLFERITSGQRRAFYLLTTNASGIRYTNGTAVGAVAAADARMQILQGVGLGTLFGSVFSPRTWNGTIHYTTVLDVPGDAATIQGAINLATGNNSVAVAPGTYVEAIDFLGKAILVRAAGGPNVTTIDANFSSTVVRFVNGETQTSILDGFRIRNGVGPAGQGGGIHCSSASPTIRNCILNNNRGGGAPLAGSNAGAGGIHGQTSDFLLENCTITNNLGGTGSATVVGGAGAIFFKGTATIRDGVVVSNFGGNAAGGTAGAGGILFGSLATIQLSGTTVGGNTGGNGQRGGAGGLRGYGDSTGTIDACRFTANTGGTGTTANGGAGGFDISNAHATIRNCLVAGNLGGNSSAGRGGAGGTGFDSDNAARLTNTTIWNNVAGVGPAGSSGGGIFVFQPINSAPVITNTIAFGDSSPEVVVVLVGPNAVPPTITYCDIQGGFAGAGNLAAAPLFVNAAAGDFHLLAASPCVDAGTAAIASLPATDFEGDPRTVFAAPDIGADEVSSPYLPGTGEDLAMELLVNGVASISASAGAALQVRTFSPLGIFTGDPPLLALQLFPSTTPPAGLGLIGLPMIHFDLAALRLLFDGTVATPLGPIGLPQAGLAFLFTVPPGLAGNTVRFQAVVISPAALNGAFAASGAYDLVLR